MGRRRFDRRAWNQVTHLGAKQDLPGLVKVMKESLDDNIRSHAADLLGELSWKATSYLDWVCYCITCYQLDAIRKQGDVIIPSLVTLLSSPISKYRERSASILNEMGWVPSNEAERIAYSIEKEEWWRLVEIGSNAVEPLFARYKEARRYDRSNIIEALGKIKDPRVPSLLMEALTDSYRYVRYRAADAMSTFGRDAVEPLIEALNAVQDGSRAEIIQALGKIGDERAIEPLMNLLSDPMAGVRNAAINALVKMGAVDASGKKVSTEEEEIRTNASKKTSSKITKTTIKGKSSDIAAGESTITTEESTSIYKRSSNKAEKSTNEGEKTKIVVKKSTGTAKKTTIKGKKEQSSNPIINPIINQLLNSLKDTSALKRIAATEALGKIADPMIVKPLCDVLQDPAPDVRKSAAIALGKLKDESSVDALIGCLHDSYTSVRIAVIDSLERIGHNRAVSPLNELLSDPDIKIRKKAADVLRKFKDPISIEALLTALKGLNENNEHQQSKGAESKTNASSNQVINPSSNQNINPNPNQSINPNPNINSTSLYEKMAAGNTYYSRRRDKEARLDPNKQLKVSILTALGNAVGLTKGIPNQNVSNSQMEEAVDIFIKFLADSDSSVVHSARSSLIKIGEPAIDLLLKNSTNPDFKMRANIVDILGDIHDMRAIPNLIEFLKDPMTTIRERAVVALGEIGQEACINPLLNCLKDSAPNVREVAIKSLAKIDNIRFWDSFIQALKDSDIKVRISAVAAIAQRKNDDAYDILCKLVNDPSPIVRRNVLHEIHLINYTKSYRKSKEPNKYDDVTPQIQAMNDENEDLVYSAMSNLYGVKDKRIVEPALRLFINHSDKRIRCEAAYLLGLNGDSRAVQPLVDALQDSDYEIWNAALKALKEIHDPLSILPLSELFEDPNHYHYDAIADVLLSFEEVNPQIVVKKYLQKESSKWSRERFIKDLKEKGIKIDWSKV